MRREPLIVPPRPPIDEGTKWRRILDRVLFRRDLREQLLISKAETEAANDRRTEGASAAHDGMFKIESLGVVSSEVTVRKDGRMLERSAEVTVWSMSGDARYGEVVSFEGQTYIITSASAYEHDHFAGDMRFDLKLRGIML